MGLWPLGLSAGEYVLEINGGEKAIIPVTLATLPAGAAALEKVTRTADPRRPAALPDSSWWGQSAGGHVRVTTGGNNKITLAASATSPAGAAALDKDIRTADQPLHNALLGTR